MAVVSSRDNVLQRMPAEKREGRDADRMRFRSWIWTVMCSARSSRRRVVVCPLDCRRGIACAPPSALARRSAWLGGARLHRSEIVTITRSWLRSRTGRERPHAIGVIFSRSRYDTQGRPWAAEGVSATPIERRLSESAASSSGSRGTRRPVCRTRGLRGGSMPQRTLPVAAAVGRSGGPRSRLGSHRRQATVGTEAPWSCRIAVSSRSGRRRIARLPRG